MPIFSAKTNRHTSDGDVPSKVAGQETQSRHFGIYLSVNISN